MIETEAGVSLFDDDETTDDTILVGLPFPPRVLKEFVGQEQLVKRLNVSIRAAKRLREPVPHLLLEGPSGIGKATLASLIPNELGTLIQSCDSTSIKKPADLLPFLTNLEDCSILFLDSFELLKRAAVELLIPALQNCKLEFVLGEGLSARTMSMNLKRFTLIAAVQSSKKLRPEVRRCFSIHERLEPYSPSALAAIVRRYAESKKYRVTSEALFEIVRDGSGTPKDAIDRFEWVRKYVLVQNYGELDLDSAIHALSILDRGKGS